MEGPQGPALGRKEGREAASQAALSTPRRPSPLGGLLSPNENALVPELVCTLHSLGGGVVFKFTKAGPTQDLLADTPQGPEAPQPSLLSAKQGKAAAAGQSRARPQKGESLPAQG